MDQHMDPADQHGHASGLQPLVGRSPGGALPPTPAQPGESLPPLGPGSERTVGVVDTGVSLDASGEPHPWFDGHLSYCREEDEDLPVTSRSDLDASAEERVLAADGHGTFVAGLILDQAPTARVRMWGVLDAARAEVDGLGWSNDRAVAAAIRALAINPRVAVINLSFGGGVFERGYAPELLRSALADVDLSRVAVVAAAGNEAGAGRVYPAAFEGVISVAALDPTDAPSGTVPPVAPFSNDGDWIDAYAVGVDLLGPALQRAPGAEGGAVRPGAVRAGGWQRWSGTSFAAAIVSGRIAAVAIEHGICGADAARAVLSESPSAHGKPWVQQSGARREA